MKIGLEYREIIGYPGYLAGLDGSIYSMKTERFLKCSYDKQGYARVAITFPGSITKTVKVHMLVAIAFLNKCSNCTDVNHKNGIKSDNRAINLEWCTKSQNAKHAFKTGLNNITDKQRERFIKMAKSQTKSKNPASKKVIDTVTGRIYDTVADAALSVGLKCTTLSMMLNGSNPNKTNLKFI